ncbi:MAG: hypothetical protein HC905_08835, partial [Bacteroidales bacterium]|nr:hypothetical protein [Bacteroidales bacterium]
MVFSSIVLILFIGALVFIRFRLFQERKRNAYLISVVEERTSELELQRKQLEIKNNELEEVNRQTVSQKDQLLAQHEHLLELHEKLKEVNEQKVNFFTNISHEIRTPLTLIAGPIEVLIAEGNLSVAQEDRMMQVQQQINYLLCLVNQLLDYRKLENGSMKLETGPGEFISFSENIYQSFVFEAHSQ